mmetsp:Transcript_20073/g.36283  ORF Transcript_20073/g.36283 Transcript_20073/m.36283 type:complete len:289 (+) Transcript_20073:69-935(+)
MCGPGGDASWTKSDVESGPSKALVQAVEQLASIANRIRGVPLGQELSDLAQTLQDEIAAMKGGVNDSDTVSALAATLANEREEREELRQSFAMHMVESAKREEALEAECTKLRIETPAKFQEQLSVALKEEADIARTARKQLVKEVDALKAELLAERATVQALKAEVSAFRALRGTFADASKPASPTSAAEAHGMETANIMAPRGDPKLLPSRITEVLGKVTTEYLRDKDVVKATDSGLDSNLEKEGESAQEGIVTPSLASQTSGRHQLTGSCRRELNFINRDFAVKA